MSDSESRYAFTCPNCAPEGSAFSNANSNHPGGANYEFVARIDDRGFRYGVWMSKHVDLAEVRSVVHGVDPDALTMLAFADRLPVHRLYQMHSAKWMCTSVSRTDPKLLPRFRVNCSGDSGPTASNVRSCAQ